MLYYTVKFTTEFDEVFTYTGLDLKSVREMLMEWLEDDLISISVERE